MVDLLISVLLSGLAVTFIVELLALMFVLFVNKETLYMFLPVPLSFGAMYAFYDIELVMLITVPATAFIALMLNKYLNKPTVISNRINRL